MSGTLRIIDSGIRSARENLAMTEALSRQKRAGGAPDTLRFQHFPPSAIIGRHQLLAREVDLDWCRANHVGTARRMTGGGAIVMGPGILGWEMIIARALVPDTLAGVSETICNGVAAGLRQLGVVAAFRPRNDIEVEGKKISGTGGYFDGACLVFQGTVLVALDRALLTSALNLPAHKLGKRGLASLADRVTDLATILGTPPTIETIKTRIADSVSAALGLAPVWGALDPHEENAARTIHDDEIGTEGFVTGADDALPGIGKTLRITRPTPGGVIDLAIKLLDGSARTIDQVLITGDFFVSPPRVIADLEAHLRHRPLAGMAAAAQAFLAAEGAAFLGMTPTDIVAALTEAAGDPA